MNKSAFFRLGSFAMFLIVIAGCAGNSKNADEGVFERVDLSTQERVLMKNQIQQSENFVSHR
ncbi:MAG TPA: hypothetical protein VD913_06030 [bacterium]|nr:hypothetical protein [bacterium]